MSSGGSPPQEGVSNGSSTGFELNLAGVADASRLTPLGRLHMPGARDNPNPSPRRGCTPAITLALS